MLTDDDLTRQLGGAFRDATDDLGTPAACPRRAARSPPSAYPWPRPPRSSPPWPSSGRPRPAPTTPTPPTPRPPPRRHRRAVLGPGGRDPDDRGRRLHVQLPRRERAGPTTSTPTATSRCPTTRSRSTPPTGSRRGSASTPRAATTPSTSRRPPATAEQVFALLSPTWTHGPAGRPVPQRPAAARAAVG